MEHLLVKVILRTAEGPAHAGSVGLEKISSVSRNVQLITKEILTTFIPGSQPLYPPRVTRKSPPLAASLSAKYLAPVLTL